MVVDEQLALFGRGAVDFVGAEDLREKLAAGKKLRVKQVRSTQPGKCLSSGGSSFGLRRPAGVR